MRVGIIGAGLSGLAAAVTLREAGHEVVVIEKSRGVGGRIASRRVEGTVVDHGVPVLPTAGPVVDRARGLPDAELVAVGDDAVACRSGLTRLAKLLADGVDVVLGVRIAALRAAGERWELAGEQGNTHGIVDAVVVSAPAPQAADLLERSPGQAARAQLLRSVRYAPAIMLLAGLRIPAPQRLEPFEPAHPIERIVAENVKGRPPVDGVVPVVARLAADVSDRLMDESDPAVGEVALPALLAACGAADREPAWLQVKRWRFAEALDSLDPALVNPSGSRIVVCGDAVTPGGLDAVYASGVAAARAVMEAAAG